MVDDSPDVETDPKLAFMRFSEAAALGDDFAVTGLASCYAEGRGVDLDYAKALELFASVADKVPNAKALLSDMYERGLGTPRDPEKSMALLTEAIQAGSGTGLALLGRKYMDGRGVPQDMEKAISLLRASVAAGDSGGQALLGMLYLQGDGVAQDFAEAKDLLEKAASGPSGGQPSAKYCLASMYQYGLGVTENYEKAYALYCAAIGPNQSIGEYGLATMYELGQGRPINLDKALELYRTAQAKGHPIVAEDIERLEKQMRPGSAGQRLRGWVRSRKK